MRVLVLTSSTGGGHDMRARSFAAWAQTPEAAPLGLEVRIHPTLESTHPLYKFGVHTYNWIQKTWPRLHHLYFNYLELARMHKSAKRMMGRQAFQEVLLEYRPDLLLSVHAHLNHGFFEIARETLPGVRCATYCGELFGRYGFSRLWVNPKADLFIGAASETCEAARGLGMPEARNWEGGFLLNPAIYGRLPAGETEYFITEDLQFDPSSFILVLSTGAVGANNHLRLLNALDQAGLNLQVVALCGKNEATLAELKAWKPEKGDIRLRPLGYFTNMNLLLRAASAVVARPGTGTTSEAILCGCPILFNGIGGIMPQEYITLKFAKARGFGTLLRRPGDLPRHLKPWLMNPMKLRAEKARLAEAVPARHPLDILQKVANLPTASL
jgi:processive 1,2-diacylglycerol beta-glucosyltransferase